jgi:hypothetical protein
MDKKIEELESLVANYRDFICYMQEKCFHCNVDFNGDFCFQCGHITSNYEEDSCDGSTLLLCDGCIRLYEHCTDCNALGPIKDMVHGANKKIVCPFCF